MDLTPEERELAKHAFDFMDKAYTALDKPGQNQLKLALSEVSELVFFPLRSRVQLKNKRNQLTQERNLKSLEEEFAEIPLDKTVPVPTEIGVPLMESLLITSNEDIAKMYINILKKAAHEDYAHMAHPHFKRLVESISADEAKMIYYLKGQVGIQYLTLGIENTNSKTRSVKHKYLISIPVDIHYKDNIDLYIDNFIALGILTNRPGINSPSKEAYDGLIKRYSAYAQSEANKLRENIIPGDRAYLESSFLELSALGRKFVDACTTMPKEQPNSL